VAQPGGVRRWTLGRISARRNGCLAFRFGLCPLLLPCGFLLGPNLGRRLGDLGVHVGEGRLCAGLVLCRNLLDRDAFKVEAMSAVGQCRLVAAPVRVGAQHLPHLEGLEDAPLYERLVYADRQWLVRPPGLRGEDREQFGDGAEKCCEGWALLIVDSAIVPGRVMSIVSRWGLVNVSCPPPGAAMTASSAPIPTTGRPRSIQTRPVRS
jgi:hypothetical protein